MEGKTANAQRTNVCLLQKENEEVEVPIQWQALGRKT